MNYDNNGFIAGFLSNLPAPAMHEPDEYSLAVIENIVNKYKKMSIEINQAKNNTNIDTNIIFVMNETFSDPFNLEGIESNKDPLVNYREIIQESINGNIMSPSIGGGTATNEFQVLTGISMEPFSAHITSPYVQLVSEMKNFPSIVNKLKNLNYRATAIHPYSPNLYRRTDVYNNLGFDEFRHENNMIFKEKISKKHRYISDLSAYQEIFDVMSKSKEIDFIHLVTMQNHAPYAVKYDKADYEVVGTGNNVEANPYFKDLENSDTSLKTLINKIDSFPEPVLLVFWGDHLPGFYKENILNNNSMQKMRETPFLIYSNKYDLNEDIKVISPIYLGNYITKILDIKITPYEAMLRDLENKLPILENSLYLEEYSKKTVPGRKELSKEAQDLLLEYTLIMYDVTTGRQFTNELGFFDYFE